MRGSYFRVIERGVVIRPIKQEINEAMGDTVVAAHVYDEYEKRVRKQVWCASRLKVTYANDTTVRHESVHALVVCNVWDRR